VEARTHLDRRLYGLTKAGEDAHQPVDGEAAEIRFPDA
jgi:hypothetical protein